MDARGNAIVTAPIVQVTGEPALTPYPLGSCGNDFTWRPTPHPGDAPAAMAEALARVLARRGYRGAFGLDFVVPGPGEAALIEINPRLTASFALYASWCPQLLDAHLRALAGERLDAARLPPIRGGQLIFHQLKGVGSPLPARAGDPEVVPHPGPQVDPGGVRGRLITRGEVVEASGRMSQTLMSGIPASAALASTTSQ